MRDVRVISGFTPGPSDVINRDIEMDRLRRDVEALRSENYMLATEVLCLRRELAGKAATEVLERVAAAQSADPATDDLTVCLAIEVADLEVADARLRREKAELVEALDKIASCDGLHLGDVLDIACAALRSATEKGKST